MIARAALVFLVLVWRVDALTEWSTRLCAAATSCALLAVSPVGRDGRVIVVRVDSLDDHVVHQNATLLSIDTRTGALVWHWRDFDDFYRPSLRGACDYNASMAKMALIAVVSVCALCFSFLFSSHSAFVHFSRALIISLAAIASRARL